MTRDTIARTLFSTILTVMVAISASMFSAPASAQQMSKEDAFNFLRRTTPEQNPPYHCVLTIMAQNPPLKWGPNDSQILWVQGNAENLCRGTPNTNWPRDCFKEAITRGSTWQTAIEACRYEFSGCTYAQFEAHKRTQNRSDEAAWRHAINVCLFGGAALPRKGNITEQPGLRASTQCTNKALGLGYNINQDEATWLCQARDAVTIPADCVGTLAANLTTKGDAWAQDFKVHGRSYQAALTICRAVLNAKAADECFKYGVENTGGWAPGPNGIPLDQIVEVCRMQDWALDSNRVTQQYHSYGMGMRDSCVTRNLGLERGEFNIQHAWAACRGQRLY